MKYFRNLSILKNLGVEEKENQKRIIGKEAEVVLVVVKAERKGRIMQLFILLFLASSLKI